MSYDPLSRGVTRRSFLKTAAALGVAVAAGDAALGGPVTGFIKTNVAQAQAKDEWVYSWCRQCSLPPCGIKVHVVDGVPVKIEGDPACPTNLGRLCSRGNAAIVGLYNPYRVKNPLKRTNTQKGLDQSPGWKEITWDEALATIEVQLKRVKADDPRKLVWNNGFSRSGSMIEGMEFCAAYGTPNYVEVDGPQCSVHFGSSLIMGNFTGPGYDPAFTNYFLNMGAGSVANAGYAVGPNQFVDAVARGMKVISVDPRANAEASKGEWLPMRPATDLAFILALQNVILYELKRFDVDFMKTRSNGPYLIGPDGYYVRDAASKKPLVWDPSDGKAKAFDDPSIKDYALEGSLTVNGVVCQPGFQIYKKGMEAYTPEWAEKKCTVPAATTRRIAKEFVDAAQIGSTITIEGSVFPYRPVCISSGRGSLTHYYDANLHVAVVLVNMLVGALDTVGSGRGGLGPQHKCTPIALALRPDADGVVAPKLEAAPKKFVYPPDQIDGKTYFPFSHDDPHVAFDCILDPKKHNVPYDTEVMFVWAGNAVLHSSRQEPVLEAVRKQKFVFTLSYSLDELAEMADIVLPESASLERVSTGGAAALADTKDGPKQAVIRLVSQQVVKPLYNSWQPDDVIMELGKRAGVLFGPGGMNDLINGGTLDITPAFKDPFKLALDKQYSAKELANLALKSDFGPDADVDAMRTKASCQVRIVPQKAMYPYTSFPAGKTRYAVYQEYLKRSGDTLRANLKAAKATVPGWDIDVMTSQYMPVPQWFEPVRPAPAAFDLWAVNWKTAQFSFGTGGSQENAWLREVAEHFDPFIHVILVNRKTGQARGLKDGDMVLLESQYGGKVQGPVKLTETMQPETIGIAGNFGHKSREMAPIALKGIHFNQLMSPDPADIDPISGGFAGAPKVKMTKV
jgi:anaerobic selenocysteine-containing dehydrogenase